MGIRIWNSSNGSLLNSVDTKSQVSSHGYINNEVVIWRYPAMVKVGELLGHTERVLHTALSPDGTTIVSAGADETLRLWKCFAPDPSKRKDEAKGKQGPVSCLRMGIR